MNQSTEAKRKSIWKMIPIMCLFMLFFINSFGKRFGDEVQLILVGIVLMISLTSTVMWMREDRKNGTLKKFKLPLLLAFVGISVLMIAAAYFWIA
ncbi:MAG: hypothetical protein EOO48_01520 [Flavobacterium sp.]|nr:MAG: hypothetical protein EOO48_01520 [Flavobacterium sp.]